MRDTSGMDHKMMAILTCQSVINTFTLVSSRNMGISPHQLKPNSVL